MVLIRDDIPHTSMQTHEFDEVNIHVESIIFELIIKNFKFHLLAVYKNPNVSNEIFTQMASNTIESLNETWKESILVGDINIDMNDNDNLFDKNVCDVHALSNIITGSTCFKSMSGTLLDPVIVSNKDKFVKPFNVACGLSDFHNMVGCVTRTSFPKPHPFKLSYRSYKTFDQIKFQKAVDSIPLSICEAFDDPDDQYWAFSHMYSEILNEHAPIKSKVVRRSKVPYMTSGLMKEIYFRNRLKNLFYQNRSSHKWELYRKQRNKVTNLRRIAIKEYFVNKCRKPNLSPRDFWGCVKPFFSKNVNQGSGNIILKESGNVICEQSEVCNTLNNYFVTMADDIGSDQRSNQGNTHNSVCTIQNIVRDKNSQFNFTCVTDDYVRKKLKNIKCNKSTGFDSVPPKTVKLCFEELSKPFTFIVNSSFGSCTFPHDMKKAEVSPVFKKKCPMTKENYRPINIVSVFSKVFEAIIAEQIEHYMNAHFNDLLGAYRKGHGCSQVLTYAVDIWKRALDRNHYVATLFMDLSRAFDSIPHVLLITKLKAYGFSENACQFMTSYLKGRQQRVKINGTFSDWAGTTKGIPQGSCLGPLLFNVFINDIFSHIKACKIFNYADDNSLSATNEKLDIAIDHLISDTKIAIEWFQNNFMKVNPEKFQIMFISPFDTNLDMPNEITINDTCKIQPSTEVQLLGMNIDNKLNFDNHVRSLCKKASKQLKVLYRFRNVLGKKEKELLFNAFIISCFNFCPIVWNFCGKTSIKLVEKVQEKALRFVMNDYQSTYNELLNNSKRCTLHVARLRVLAVEVFKCVHKMNPKFLNNIVVKKESTYEFRDTLKLEVPKFCKIKYGKNTFSYYGPHIWNQIPSSFKKEVDLCIFKRLIATWNGPSCRCTSCYNS